MAEGDDFRSLAARRLKKMESCMCRALASIAFCELLAKNNPINLPASLEELDILLQAGGVRREGWGNYDGMLPIILEELNFLLVEEATEQD